MVRKNIDVNTIVEVKNNLEDSFIYDGRDNQLRLSGRDVSDSLSVRELKSTMAGQKRRNLMEFYILLDYTDDEDISVDDVLEYIRLKEHYNKAKEILGVQEDEQLDTHHFTEFVEVANKKMMDEALTELPELITVLTEQGIKAYKNNNIDAGAVESLIRFNGIDDVHSFLDDLRSSYS